MTYCSSDHNLVHIERVHGHCIGLHDAVLVMAYGPSFHSFAPLDPIIL